MEMKNGILHNLKIIPTEYLLTAEGGEGTVEKPAEMMQGAPPVMAHGQCTPHTGPNGKNYHSLCDVLVQK